MFSIISAFLLCEKSLIIMWKQWRQSLEKPGGDCKITRAAENLKMRGAKNLQWGALYNIKF